MTRRVLLLPLASALIAVPAFAEPTPAVVPLQMGPIAQGSQTLLTKPVQSWKALKFKGMVRQQSDFSCGAAALATIFNFAYGKTTNERQVLVNMMKVSDPEVVKEKGFSLLDMKSYVKAVGFSGEGFEVPYSALESLKVPGIVLLNIKGYKHFVVIRKVDGDYVHVADPALGNRVLARPAFEKAWNGVVFVVLGEGYNADNALRNPPPPLSARRLYDQRSPIRDAEASDFGIQSATSFSF